ncbi:MAG TPA: hypothetical protein EYN66_11095 [Myxococcales bacterium]|nr:hypothetical protein [Myxococcales bacterium]
MSGHLGYNSFLYGNQYLAMDMGFDFVSEFMGVPQNTVTIAKAVNEWLEAHKDEKFFLLVWFEPPHFPYVAPKGYKQRVYKAGVKKDFRFFDHGYLSKLMYGDEYFGHVARKLEELGLSKNTLQIVTADHGECMDYRHDGYSKNVNTRVARHHGKSFFDEEIHVPLMLRLDGVLDHKTRVKTPVSLVSLAPTIQDMLGFTPQLPKQFGRSFAGLAKGESEAAPRTVYFEGRWSYGIRNARWKYIFHDRSEKLQFKRKSLWQRKRDGYHELFDLTADPDELTNVSLSRPEALEQMKQRYSEIRAQLRRFRREQLNGAPLPPIVKLPWEK